MSEINLGWNRVVSEENLLKFQDSVEEIHNKLHSGNEDYTGWIDYPKILDKDEIDRFKCVSKKIKENSDIFIVIGVGGSYLGAKAAIEMLNHSFYNELYREKRNGPRVYFAGYDLCGESLSELLDMLDGFDISVNVISKSGTTMEPALAFRVIMDYMKSRYSELELKERIYLTTDSENGALREKANIYGYESFSIPGDIGGRYSVLTPVGLLPMAVAGINIEEVIEGAKNAMADLSNPDILKNSAYQYALIRNILYSEGKHIEVLASYTPKISYFGEWYKQLFGESEGKEHKGIFPSHMCYTRDLHSMGQYIQDGRRDIFETFINIEKSCGELSVPNADNNLDGLDYLVGSGFDFLNKSALSGTLKAHTDGGVPCIVLNIPKISPYYFGYMSYFFMKSCAMSGYLLGVNPFDQPGVEEYKRNIKELLRRG